MKRGSWTPASLSFVLRGGGLSSYGRFPWPHLFSGAFPATLFPVPRLRGQNAKSKEIPIAASSKFQSSQKSRNGAGADAAGQGVAMKSHLLYPPSRFPVLHLNNFPVDLRRCQIYRSCRVARLNQQQKWHPTVLCITENNEAEWNSPHIQIIFSIRKIQLIQFKAKNSK